MADRIYKFAKDVIDAIDSAEYNDNSPVSADPVVSTITIFNWDDVKALDQTTINTLAVAKGFSVV